MLEREHAEAAEEGHRLWSAIDPAGGSVGWLWVKPIDLTPSRGAFLHQITVARTSRRQGYGRAILAALEEVLARHGVDELRP